MRHIFQKIVETLPPPITRESFVKAASTFKADLEGLSVEFSRGGNQALGKVYFLNRLNHYLEICLLINL